MEPPRRNTSPPQGPWRHAAYGTQDAIQRMAASLGSYLMKFEVCEGLNFFLNLKSFTLVAAVVEELIECSRP